MKVGQICNHRPIKVSESASLSDVARVMSEEHVGAVIVTESNADDAIVSGVITDRDIVRAQLEQTSDLSRLSVRETMTRAPLTLTQELPVDMAIAHMRARDVRRAPVVTEHGAPVGMISTDDLLAHLAGKLLGIVSVVAQQTRQERS